MDDIADANSQMAAEMPAERRPSTLPTPSIARRNCVVLSKPHKKEGRGRIVAPLTVFDRRELGFIFRVYGRQVASGEWRDYSIDYLDGRAVFAVYRRACDAPLYRIEKNPRLAKRQGMYMITGMGGAILRRGHELSQLLRFFTKLRTMHAG